MTSRSYFGKMNSTLGSVVPLAMFDINIKVQPEFLHAVYWLPPSFDELPRFSSPGDKELWPGDEGGWSDPSDDEYDVNNKIGDFINDLTVHHLHGFEVPVVSEHFLTCSLSICKHYILSICKHYILSICKHCDSEVLQKDLVEWQNCQTLLRNTPASLDSSLFGRQ